jgi:hypothetical protein
MKSNERADANPLAGVMCFKYGCRSNAHTVEREEGKNAERFPSALCKEHARRPDKPGTFEDPTWVRI